MARYDDEHRGPAVTDAYELSQCRIELAERSQAWPIPENLPPRMIEFAERIPEDQRTDWLRRQAASEEVDRLISHAMRSGGLPIWVAPIGEPERLVAPGAMVEVDHATIVSGCYRPPNDRGWLHGRPLFVKRADWARFATAINRDKTPGTEAHHCAQVFDRDDAATIAPWWSVNQALAWIVTRIASYVEYIGSLENDEPREHRPYIVQAICEFQVAESDEGKAFLNARRASWPTGSLLAHAGRVLLEKILAGEVGALTRQNGQGRRMLREDFVGIGSRETGDDWLDLDPQPLFSSAEIIEVFSPEQAASDNPSVTVGSSVGAENECRAWLAEEFSADPERRRSKDDFRKAALSRFAGRLSERGFDNRVWPDLAKKDGRSRAGAKRKL